MAHNKKNTSFHLANKLVAFAILLVVALIVATLFFYFLADTKQNSDEAMMDLDPNIQQQSSRIFITLNYEVINNDQSSDQYINGTYAKNASDQGMYQLFTDLSQSEIVQLSFSRDRRWATFIAANKNLFTEEGIAMADDAYYWQVFRVDLSESTIEEAVNDAAQITDLVAANKMLPSVNNNGEVVYMSFAEGTNEFNTEVSTSPSDWGIYHISKEGVTTKVATGMYPKWINDSEVIYISNEGLVTYNIDTAEQSGNLLSTLPESLTEVSGYDFSDTSVRVTDSPASLFDIADDGSVLVLSLPGLEKVYSFHVEREDNGTMNFRPTALLNETIVAWPQISPNGKNIGLFEYGQSEYSVYSSDLLEPVADPFYLGNFDIAGLKVTDWY